MQPILQWFGDHKWVPFATLVIYLAMRLLKDDTKGPTIKSDRLRFFLLFALGAASGVLERYTGGAGWEKAIYDGFAAAVGALLIHQGVNKAALGGKELRIPKLMKDEDPKPPPSGPSILSLIALGAVLSLTQNACTAQQRAQFLKDTFADKLRCGMDNLNLPNDELLRRCLVNGDDIERFLDLIGKERIALANRAAEVAQVEQERFKRQIEEVRAAAARDRELDKQRAAAGCGGYRDGGLRPGGTP